MESGYPKPAKSLPENAASIHPSVVLHQMKPNVQYNIEILTRDNLKYFVATAVIDGQEFSGEGIYTQKLFDIIKVYEKKNFQSNFIYGNDTRFECFYKSFFNKLSFEQTFSIFHKN